MTEFRIKVVDNLRCPKCGATESHPRYKDMILIRGFKVDMGDGYWWSQCLVCAGYYDANLEPKPIAPGERWPADADPNKGWF